MAILTKEESDAVLGLLLGRHSSASAFRVLGWEPPATDALFALLSRALTEHDEAAVDLGVSLCGRHVPTSAPYLPVLVALLAADWHHQHEALVDELGTFDDPTALEAVCLRAQRRVPSRSWDDARSLEHRCIRLLRNVGTVAAIERLALLATPGVCDEEVRALAVSKLRGVATKGKSDAAQALAVRKIAEME